MTTGPQDRPVPPSFAPAGGGARPAPDDARVVGSSPQDAAEPETHVRAPRSSTSRPITPPAGAGRSPGQPAAARERPAPATPRQVSSTATGRSDSRQASSATGRPALTPEPGGAPPSYVPGSSARPIPVPGRTARSSTGAPAGASRPGAPGTGSGPAGRSVSSAPSGRSAAGHPGQRRPSPGPGTAVTPPSRPRIRHPRRRLIVAGLVVLLLAAIAWPVGLVIWANGKIHHIEALSGAAGTGGTTYLITGSDQRGGDGVEADGTDGARTDTIMVLQVPASGPVALISLPRDTYVDIPGHGPAKLNAAYSWGGAPLLVRTVEQLTGLTIDHYAEIGMGGVKEVVNAVGGVNLCWD
ncbi:MAG: LCP family protein, partial [Actinobacteria bacterium]|nr:LCP family protein [Actinomycetota bacterium]